jgi:hypothetical protein
MENPPAPFNKGGKSKELELLRFIRDECPDVARMKRQLTADEAEQLLAEYPLADIKAQLQKMENWRDIHKNKSVFLTIKKWFEMDIKKGFYKPQKNTRPAEQPSAIKEFFKRFEPGSRVQVNNTIYEVCESGFLRNTQTNAMLPIAQASRISNIKRVE